MFQRSFEQREAVGAALDPLHTDLLPLSSLENDTVEETAKLFGPFSPGHSGTFGGETCVRIKSRSSHEDAPPHSSV